MTGKKYTKVDVGDSGKYMVDNEGKIGGIKLALGGLRRSSGFIHPVRIILLTELNLYSWTGGMVIQESFPVMTWI
jgi:hypothetical protein